MFAPRGFGGNRINPDFLPLSRAELPATTFGSFLLSKLPQSASPHLPAAPSGPSETEESRLDKPFHSHSFLQYRESPPWLLTLCRITTLCYLEQNESYLMLHQKSYHLPRYLDCRYALSLSTPKFLPYMMLWEVI